MSIRGEVCRFGGMPPKRIRLHSSHTSERVPLFSGEHTFKRRSSSSSDSYHSCKDTSFDSWKSCTSDAFYDVDMERMKFHLLNEFKRHVDKKVEAFREDVAVLGSQVQSLNVMYRKFLVKRPRSDEEYKQDRMFMNVIDSLQKNNSVMFDKASALRSFRKKARIHGVQPALNNFRFNDFMLTDSPTVHDKPDFTGPYIAGPFSEELTRLYKKYRVRRGEYEGFLQNLLTQDDASFFDKELARYVLNRKQYRENQIAHFRSLDDDRSALKATFQKEPIDLLTLDEIYSHLYGNKWPYNWDRILKDIYKENDLNFMKHLDSYRNKYPGPFDTMRAFDYYRKKSIQDPFYFIDPKLYNFQNYRIQKPKLVEDYPFDFTGPLLAGPYSHELLEIYKKYHVKPGTWREFLLNLQNDPNAMMFDRELAKHVLEKEISLKKELEIEDIKKHFYRRATGYDLEQLNRILRKPRK